MSVARRLLDTYSNETKPDLSASLHALVVAHFRFNVRPSNGQLAQEASRLGLHDGKDFAVVYVAIDDRAVALVAIASQHWRNSDMMKAFYQLRTAAKWQGESVVLVPEGFIRREPRCSNSMRVAATRGTVMRLTDRIAVLEHLVEFGTATLSELAALVRHPDPVAAVLSLCVEGLLDVDLNRPILSTTLVTMGASR